MEYQQHVLLGEGGRIIIPAAFRKELNIAPGDDLIMKIDNGELKIYSQLSALERARKLLKPTKKVKSATDDFLKFRKKDSE